MPLKLVQRGAVLRNLRIGDAIPRPNRVIAVQNQVRRVCLSANNRFANPIARTKYPLGGLSRDLSNSYATAAGSSKGQTKEPKASKATKSGKKTSKKSASGESNQKKKKPTKELTEEQKEAKKAKAQKVHVKELKETALTVPKKLTDRAWNLAVQSKLSEAIKSHDKITEAFTQAAVLARNITESEQEAFASQAESNRAANVAAYEEWINSHTPSQIKDANLARKRLAKLTGKKYPALKDPRLVKQPVGAYMLFNHERLESGDFKYMKVRDLAARISEEWRGLTDGEKQKYFDMQAADRERYNREHLEAYGKEPPASKNKA